MFKMYNNENIINCDRESVAEKTIKGVASAASILGAALALVTGGAMYNIMT